MNAYTLKVQDIRYLKERLLDDQGELRVLPYAELADVPQEHLSQFCVEHGIYAVPTQELIDFLLEEISGCPAIEIGAGNGAICKALGITGTDNFMQLRPDVKHWYETHKQAIVSYGQHVKNIDAVQAVKRFKPKVVVAAWVTHKYNPREAWREGNQDGVKEEEILDRVQKYVFVGNTKVHGQKPILAREYNTIGAHWLLSRSMHRENNCLYFWEREW